MKTNVYSRIFYFCAIIVFCMVINPSRGYSQSKSTIKGVVQDSTTKEIMPGTMVIIEGTTKGAIAGANGEFVIENVARNTDVKLQFSFIGYKDKSVTVKPNKSVFVVAQPILMEQSGIDVGTAVITGAAPIAVQKGDTTQYNAEAFKTNPDATAEDLLAKMPGFKIKNGKAEAQGESITQVYVDGKAYFKNDPATALNSLPADAVESIQLFDEKSDQSKFTGFDDGERNKSINIVTKNKQKNSAIGDYIAGYGTDGRYTIKTNTNIFTEKHRFTFGFGFNNINQSAISGGGRFYGGRSGSSGGITTANGVKLNYSGEFKKDSVRVTNLGANYTFTNSLNELTKVLEQSYFNTPQSNNRFYTEALINNSLSDRHSASVDLESSINENNKVIFRPSFNYTHSGSNVSSLASNIVDDKLTNNANTKTATHGDSYNVNAFLMWMHKFNNKRSLTIDSRVNISNSDRTQLLTGSNGFYNNQIMWEDSLINQNTVTLNNDNTIGYGASYTEALSPKSGLIFRYSGSYNWSTSDKKTYMFNPNTGLYEDIDVALSNVFNRDYITNSAGIGYTYRAGSNMSLSAGADYQYASLANTLVYPKQKDYDYDFNSIIGNVRFDYSLSKSKRITAFFRGRPQLPSVTQLQDVVDNSNPIKITTGNPDLKQSYMNMFAMMYNASNTDKGTTFRLYSFMRNNMNSIANNTRFMSQDTVINGVSVQKGAQISSPVNISGQWTINAGAEYAFPIKPIKSNLSLNLGYNYSRLPYVYNDVASFSRNNGGSFGLSLSSNISSNVDFTIFSNTNASRASNSTGTAANNTYINENAGVKLNLIFLKGFVFNTDYSYNYNYYSTNAPENPSFNMLNMGLGYKFLKNQAEIRINAYDLLNQSKSLIHSVNDMYIEDARTNILQRYFMLTFSYKFNTMKGKSANTSSSSTRSSGSGMGHPGGRPPMGGGGMMH